MMVIRNIRYHVIGVLCLAAVALTGCDTFSTPQAKTDQERLALLRQEQRDQAVSLYVDAMMLNEINDYAAALRKLELATEMDKDFALAYSMKGDLYQAEQQYEKSADAYERAATLDPWSFKDFFNLGKVSQVLKQFLRAANAYVAAAKLNPQHYEAHLGAAQSFFELKDVGQAQQYAQKAKQIDPKQAEPELLLGDIFEEQKDHMEAINAYRRALELQGNQPKVMVALARSYLRTGRFSSAKELLTDVLAAEPENAVAHQYLGFAHLKLKETQEAIKSYKLAVKFGKDDWMAHKSLGVAYMLSSMQNNNDEKIKALAVEQWNISLQINSDQPQLRELLAKYN
jgi:tetratricopeptide (TPR) repeat protein